jgi:hypothetical protein
VDFVRDASDLASAAVRSDDTTTSSRHAVSRFVADEMDFADDELRFAITGPRSDADGRDFEPAEVRFVYE